MNKLLTNLALKVMNLLWKLDRAHVKEIVEVWPEAEKPAYNTISTTVRILQEKEFIGHEAQGRTHLYFPLISKRSYQLMHIKSVLENVFAGSATSLVSALVDQEKLSEKEIDDIRDMIAKGDH